MVIAAGIMCLYLFNAILLIFSFCFNFFLKQLYVPMTRITHSMQMLVLDRYLIQSI